MSPSEPRRATTTSRTAEAPEQAGAHPLHVRHLDHVVLAVADVERSLAWYCDELGLRPERVEQWRRGDAPFPSVRIDDATIIDLVARPAQPAERDGIGNMDHLCFVVGADDVTRVVASDRFEVVDGPAPRFGARGIGTSVYVRDPDGNLVELRHYGDT